MPIIQMTNTPPPTPSAEATKRPVLSKTLQDMAGIPSYGTSACRLLDALAASALVMELDFESLRTDLEAARRENGRLTQFIDKQQECILVLQPDRDALRTRVAELEDDNTQLRKRREDEARTITALENELARLNKLSASLTTVVNEDFKIITALETANKALEAQLVVIGDIAVRDWDDATVGKVDALVKEPTRYKDVVRKLFIDNPARITELEQDGKRMRGSLNQARHELTMATLRAEKANEPFIAANYKETIRFIDFALAQSGGQET